MSRTASDYTEAIRSLLDETGGSITHGEARPILESLGFDIAAKPDIKSSELSDLDEYEYDEKGVSAAIREDDMKTVHSILEPVFNSTGFDEDTQKAVINEMKVRLAFFDERNFFDVTKFNWSQTTKSEKTSQSRKPVSIKNQRAVGAVTKKTETPLPKHKRRGRPRKQQSPTVVQPTAEELLALEMIEKLGGVSNAEARISNLQAEATELTNAIKALSQLAKRSDELQKRIRSAA